MPSFNSPKHEFIQIHLFLLIQDLCEIRQFFGRLLQMKQMSLWGLWDFTEKLIEEVRLVFEESFQYRPLKEFSNCYSCIGLQDISFFIYLYWSTVLHSSWPSQTDCFFWRSMPSSPPIGYRSQVGLFFSSKLVFHLLCFCRPPHHWCFRPITIVAHSSLTLLHSPWYLK